MDTSHTCTIPSISILYWAGSSRKCNNHSHHMLVHLSIAPSISNQPTRVEACHQSSSGRSTTSARRWPCCRPQRPDPSWVILTDDDITGVVQMQYLMQYANLLSFSSWCAWWCLQTSGVYFSNPFCFPLKAAESTSVMKAMNGSCQLLRTRYQWLHCFTSSVTLLQLAEVGGHWQDRIALLLCQSDLSTSWAGTGVEFVTGSIKNMVPLTEGWQSGSQYVIYEPVHMSQDTGLAATFMLACIENHRSA